MSRDKYLMNKFTMFTKRKKGGITGGSMVRK